MSAYIYKMLWRHRGGAGRQASQRGAGVDMYFIQPEHTLWGFDDLDCRVHFIKVSDDSPEYNLARQNSELVLQGWKPEESASRPSFKELLKPYLR